MITRGASLALSQDEVLHGPCSPHCRATGVNWTKQDWKRNDAAVEHGGCLFSRYVTPSGTTFLIITEHDRSVTTILLPNEY